MEGGEDPYAKNRGLKVVTGEELGWCLVTEVLRLVKITQTDRSMTKTRTTRPPIAADSSR